MSFPCTSCGACCRRAGHVKGFPFLVTQDGACQFLAGNLCAIYEERPEICRVTEDFELNAVACNTMIREDGLGPEYLVRIGG